MNKLPLRPLHTLGWIAGAIALSSISLGCATEQTDLSNRELTDPNRDDLSSTVIPAEGELPSEAIATQPTNPEQAFPNPNIPVDETTSVDGGADIEPNAASLIQPTNLSGHAARIQSGRNDPFAPLDSQAVVISSNPALATPTIPAAPATVPPLPAPQAIGTVPVESTPLPAVTPGDSPATSADAVAVAPTPGRLADTIEIMGVVEAGGQISIILRVPNESTSRYVRVGEYLANGQVLVKRVDMQSGGEPIVVLEQDGVEIPRYVSGATLG
jgi:hypothetical protein